MRQAQLAEMGLPEASPPRCRGTNRGSALRTLLLLTHPPLLLVPGRSASLHPWTSANRRGREADSKFRTAAHRGQLTAPRSRDGARRPARHNSGAAAAGSGCSTRDAASSPAAPGAAHSARCALEERWPEAAPRPSGGPNSPAPPPPPRPPLSAAARPGWHNRRRRSRQAQRFPPHRPLPGVRRRSCRPRGALAVPRSPAPRSGLRGGAGAAPGGPAPGPPCAPGARPSLPSPASRSHLGAAAAGRAAEPGGGGEGAEQGGVGGGGRRLLRSRYPSALSIAPRPAVSQAGRAPRSHAQRSPRRPPRPAAAARAPAVPPPLTPPASRALLPRARALPRPRCPRGRGRARSPRLGAVPAPRGLRRAGSCRGASPRPPPLLWIWTDAGPAAPPRPPARAGRERRAPRRAPVGPPSPGPGRTGVRVSVTSGTSGQTPCPAFRLLSGKSTLKMYLFIYLFDHRCLNKS